MTIDLADLLERSLVVTERMLVEAERRMERVGDLTDHQLQTLTGIHSKMQSAMTRAVGARTRLAQAGKAFRDKMTDADKRDAMVEFYRDMPRAQRIDMLERLRDLVGE